VNMLTGDPNDHPTDDGLNIPTFDGGGFDDRGLHRMKLVANGETVRLYVDGVFGLETPFPFADGLTLGFGAYVGAATDIVKGYFDNALITGGSAPALKARRQGANVVISWTGTGVLESSDSLRPTAWQNVVPAPVGNSITVPASSANTRFYRLRQ
jgi:hypothetical protein